MTPDGWDIFNNGYLTLFGMGEDEFKAQIMEEEKRIKINPADQYWPCIFDDYVFYYSNGKAFKCDHDGYILE